MLVFHHDRIEFYHTMIANSGGVVKAYCGGVAIKLGFGHEKGACLVSEGVLSIL